MHTTVSDLHAEINTAIWVMWISVPLCFIPTAIFLVLAEELQWWSGARIAAWMIVLFFCIEGAMNVVIRRNGRWIRRQEEGEAKKSEGEVIIPAGGFWESSKDRRDGRPLIAIFSLFTFLAFLLLAWWAFVINAEHASAEFTFFAWLLQGFAFFSFLSTYTVGTIGRDK